MSKILLTIFILLWATAAQATDWYISHTGSANCASGCLTGAPCSLATGLTCNVVGDDYFILKDGTYTGTSLTVPWSGTAGHPITIKAENDGQAIVDGQFTKKPLDIYGRTYIKIEGIVFKNSNGHVINLNNSSWLELKRVSGYSANSSGANYHIFEMSNSSYILLEDCAASGYGRDMYLVLDSNYITVRRCWGRYKENIGGSGDIVQIYGSSNCVVENSIGTRDTGYNYIVAGILIWTNYYNAASNNNKIYGNIIWNMTSHGYEDTSCKEKTFNNEFINNVSINNRGNYTNRGDFSQSFRNNTSYDVGTSSQHFYSGAFPDTVDCTKNADYRINTVMKNNSFLTGYLGLYNPGAYVTTFTHDYNNFYNLTTTYYGTTQAAHETTINPVYDTAAYGKGAYLMVPSALQGQGENGADIGAEVLYRYVDGVLTSTPLFPWPMEYRICIETGYSVTYEGGYPGCALGGGIWKTLDGVYTGDTTPPTLPGITTITASVRDYINLDLSWNASTDDIGVVGYNIYRCAGTCTPADPGDYVTQVSGTAYSDNNLLPSTTYSYNVKAVDSSGNKSGFYTTKTQATTAPPGGQSYNVRQTDVTMSTDANCSEFADAETITIINAKPRLMWNSTALYGCAYVSDIQINNSITDHDGNLWSEDSLEMFFDTDNNQGASMTAGDYKLFLSATNVKAEQDHVSLANWTPTWTTSTKYGGSLNSNIDTDTIYIVEFQITWANWGLSAPTADSTVWGFDLSENNLNPPNITQTAWSNSTGGGFNDPTGWGTLYFKSNPKTVDAVGAGAAIIAGSGATFVLGR